MATLDVVNLEGEKVDQIEVADGVFATEVKEHLLWEVVVSQRAARRAGNASTKRRGEVRGSTAKLFRQKGTGRARAGSARAPIMVGGGSAFGPKPRSYKKRTPKKVRQGALRSALSLRLKEQHLVVVQDFALEQIKTKRVAGILDKLGASRSLVVDRRDNESLVKSMGNLATAKCIAPEGLNVYDVLRYDTLVITAGVVKQIEERLLP
jgi:large subunit ribosomal protein L4